MKSYENSFVRGPSPSYSDEATSEVTPIGVTDELDRMPHSSADNNFLDEKFNYVFDDATNMAYTKNTLKKGRNTFAFWTIITILLVLTVGNLILTLTIIGVLHLGKGIHGMELIPEEDLIKFYGTTDLDSIYSKVIGQIEGFTDVPVSITAEDGGGVFVRIPRSNAGQKTSNFESSRSNGAAIQKPNDPNRLIMDKSGIQFRAVNNFEVKDPASGSTIFNTHRPHYNMPGGAEALVAKSVSACKIASPIGKPLSLDADGRVAIKGSEGIILDSSITLLQAEHNIAINSTQGAVLLEAGSGIFLDMDKVPIVSPEFGVRVDTVQYKICVCIPQGILFRIELPRKHSVPKITCAHFSSKHDPCAVN